jgi:pyruvate-formate lyase
MLKAAGTIMEEAAVDRLIYLKKQLFDNFFVKKDWWGDDLSIFDRYPNSTGEPINLRKAMAFDMVCEEMPLELKSEELIVGTTTMSSVGFGHTFPAYETAEEAAQFLEKSLSRKSVWGHHMPYFPTVLEKGYNGILADLETRMEKTGDPETRIFYTGVRLCLESAKKVPLRYAELIEEAIADEPDPRRRMELTEIQSICRKVPAEPATTFQEALQSVWFVHMLLHSTLTYTPLGRIDQYLWPYYRHDMEAGTLTREYARELIGSFLIKFNERTQFLKEHMENHLTDLDWSQGGSPDETTAHFNMENDADYTFGQSANHWLQSATVGGLAPDGSDAVNDLSWLFIELINELELVSPMMSARVHDKTDPAFLDLVSSELCDGGAQPVIFNDDVIIRGLNERLGIPIEDARDYSSDGCWEVLIYGKSEYNYGHIEVLPCMEACINNGRSLVTGKEIGIPRDTPAADLPDFDAFYHAYMEQVRFRVDNAIKNKLQYYDEVHKIAPEPFLSALVDGCLEKGRDLTDHGAKYIIYALFPTGFSHAIDALSAVRTVVYEEKRTDLQTMIDAVKANWEGYEQLQQYCLNRTPKYGNDDPAADELAVRFLNDFCQYADAWNRRIDWLYVTAGVATFENYPRFGHNAGASFDGRLAHEAVSSNFSPSFGQDKQGPTAVLLSAAKFDLSRLDNGCPIDMRISFNKEHRKENADLLKAYIQSFLQLGGNIMTISKVDIATLKKAQIEPEKYLSLRVRLGGLTVYFVQLARKQQEEYMRRTEHRF